jgi:hypothetical protein
VTDTIEQPSIDGLPTSEAQIGWRHLAAPGLADDRWVEALRDRMPSPSAEPVVLDLRHTILTAAAPVLAALDHASRAAGGPERVAVVTPRFSALALLRRWGVVDDHPVFTDVGSAQAALAGEHPPV